jgi:hypothetical protein
MAFIFIRIKTKAKASTRVLDHGLVTKNSISLSREPADLAYQSREPTVSTNMSNLGNERGADICQY